MMDALTQDQQAIVDHSEGTLIVLAAPGSGKTRVLCERFAALIKRGEDYQKLFCLTFTRSAAQEMVRRVARITRMDSAFIWPQICTYHALGLRILQAEKPFPIDPKSPVVREGKAKRLIENVLRPGLSYKDVRAYISLNKRRFIAPLQASEQAIGFREEALAELYAEYEKQLRSMHLLDYDSLIFEAFKMLVGNPEIAKKYQERCQHLQVDEFQDTSPSEQQFSALIAAGAKSFVGVGDYHQAIFGFAGGDCSIMQDFTTLFPEAQTVFLPYNFRSTRNIIEAFRSAAPPAEGAPRQLLEQIRTGNGVGQKPTFNLYESQEAEALAISDRIDESEKFDHRRLSDHAILVRTNRQMRAMEEQCLLRGWAYQSPGCGFFGRTEVRLATAILRMLEEPNAKETIPCDCRQRRECSRCGKTGMRQAWIGQRVARSGLECVRYISPPVITAVETSSDNPYQAMAQYTDSRHHIERSVRNFYYMIEDLKWACEGHPPVKQLEIIYDRTGFIDWLRKNEDIDEGDNSRADNAMELVRAASRFAGRKEFLNFVAATEQVSRRHTSRRVSEDKLTLSTVHRAKGGEWSVVFVAGLNEGLFPHKSGDPDEEARLLYVALSRAKDELHVSGYGKPAPFLAARLEMVSA